MNRQKFREWVKKRFTLRTRLALWVMGVLLVISIGLLVLVNVATPIKTANSPEAIKVTFPAGVTPNTVAAEYPVIIAGTPAPEGSNGSTFPTTSPGTPATYTITFTTSDVEKLTGVSTSTVRKDVFHEMRVVSIIGLGIVILLGGLVAYWLAGRA